jgi:hypothetical protein
MSKRLTLALFLLLTCLAPAAADEGMWLFNAFPKDKTKAKYGFSPSQDWLDHLRLSSVRFNNGGSGSFVSADGLTFTNHHVGAKCLQELSTAQRDYMKMGFYARTREEEARCPDLELNVLREIEDVTARVHGAEKLGMSAAEIGKTQRAAMSTIEQECASKTGLRCDVVKLYAGGLYHLYKYKKYTDVRLVFAPEFDIAFFGGDPDNFNYPRYDLDIAFFRIYENDKPAKLEHYLKWSKTGMREGDLVFVSGNPGGTDRNQTVAQLDFLREVEYPFLVESLKERIAMLQKFSAPSGEHARKAQRDLFSFENAIKAYSGEYDGIKDKQLIDRKAAEERALRQFVAADPKLKAEVGAAWEEIERSVKVQREIFFPSLFLERRAGFRGTLNRIARDLVRLAAERQKPNSDRLREYRESALDSLKQTLLSTAPVYKDLETAIFAHSLAEMQRRLGNSHAVVKQVLGGKSPEEAASELIAGTKLDDVAVRQQLWEGGAAAVNASTDPLIVLMRNIDPEARAVRRRYDDEVDAVERKNGTLLAKARFAKYGLSMSPDATFTLRLSYGAIKGYRENGKNVPYFTTLSGTFERAAKQGNKPPYQLPESWMKNQRRLQLKTAFNFVSTADIIGGNSGSPVVNREGEVVGIVFDGNIQTMMWNFMYDDAQARAVSVDGRGIMEALPKVYDAEALVNELTGPSATPKKSEKGKKTMPSSANR